MLVMLSALFESLRNKLLWMMPDLWIHVNRVKVDTNLLSLRNQGAIQIDVLCSVS